MVNTISLNSSIHANYTKGIYSKPVELYEDKSRLGYYNANFVIPKEQFQNNQSADIVTITSNGKECGKYTLSMESADKIEHYI